ncbi:ORF64 [black bullhead herpesvirus]|uniref:ORF64 n=1 Tax=black bullhead herpesvirus TaxID=508441 RepID=A0A2H5AJI5_9VIRU|nr:ORF64 [black bullhead herpesvirus]AUG72313.1 ORF64 [black bullhead herpesvirus]
MANRSQESGREVDSDWILARYRALNALRAHGMEVGCEDLDGTSPDDFRDVLEAYEHSRSRPSDLSGFISYLAAMVLGIFRFSDILSDLVANDTLGIFHFNKLMGRLFFNYAIGSDELIDGLLDLMFKYIAFLSRFSIIPASVIDSNFCVLCMYESDHSLAGADTRFKTLVCSHIVESHGHATDGLMKENVVATTTKRSDPLVLTLDKFHEQVAGGEDARTLAMARDNTLTTRKNGSISSFIRAMSRARESCMVAKMEASLTEFQARLGEVTTMMTRMGEHKNLNLFSAELMNTFIHAQTRRSRVREFLDTRLVKWSGDLPPEIFLLSKLQTTADKNLLTTIIMDFYAAAVPPIYKYNHKYNMHAHRVIFFKHMESLGFTNEGITLFQLHINQLDLKKIVGQPFTDENFPVITNAENFSKLIELFWAVANIRTFVFIHNKAIGFYHGDSNKINHEEIPDGIYLFNGTVGFKHTGVEKWGGVWATQDLLKLLNVYDRLLSTGVTG